MDDEWTGFPTLILGVDIGTTYSGVTFLYLTQGVKPSQSIQRVTEWPGQRGKAEAKVPTLVWYDQNKRAVKLGAEAYKLKEHKARAERLKLAKHFKHHLHPATMAARHKLDKPPLPYGVTLEQVYVDFLRYLFENTQRFFEKAVLGGRSRWGTLTSTMKVVLAHPNGWGTPEQGFLRQAARRTGIFSNDSQISFITEAEASVYFCLSRPNLNLASRVKMEDKIAVCDAGGSTVDTTLYIVTEKNPLRLEEVKPSDCVQAGGIFVDNNARSFFEERFAQVNGLSSSERSHYVNDGVEDFISRAKNNFDDTELEVIVKVGGPKEDFDEIEVDSGDMTIPSHSVASFFNPCVNQIAESLAGQISNEKVQYIFLVGGFGDSPYLFQRLNNKFRNSLVTLNDQTAKAVADGCVIWQIENSVVSRVTRFSYGTSTIPVYDQNLRHHIGRETFMHHDGILHVSDEWYEIVGQGTSMKYNEEITSDFSSDYTTNYPDIMNFARDVYATKSASGRDFIRDNYGSLNPGFHNVCTLTGDLTALRGTLEPKMGLKGTYWQIRYKMGLRFGGTQLEGFLEWEENGNTRRGPVSIIAAAAGCE